jgi:hypothetical protein
MIKAAEKLPLLWFLYRNILRRIVPLLEESPALHHGTIEHISKW